MERPWTTNLVGFLARKDGKYTRPVIGAMVDIRLEDIIPTDILNGSQAMNILGRLPDIPDVQQMNKYFTSIFNDVQIIDQSTANRLAASGDFLILPDSPSSAYWKYTKAPWWEFAVVLDEYQGYIKAPRESMVRTGEPTPDQADEKIDDYPMNHGKVKVLAPSTIIKMHNDNVVESYLKKLSRI